MLHIVPIICLIFFIFFVEYRLKKHIYSTDKEIVKIKRILKKLQNG